MNFKNTFTFLALIFFLGRADQQITQSPCTEESVISSIQSMLIDSITTPLYSSPEKFIKTMKWIDIKKLNQDKNDTAQCSAILHPALSPHKDIEIAYDLPISDSRISTPQIRTQLTFSRNFLQSAFIFDQSEIQKSSAQSPKIKNSLQSIIPLFTSNSEWQKNKTPQIRGIYTEDIETLNGKKSRNHKNFFDQLFHFSSETSTAIREELYHRESQEQIIHISFSINEKGIASNLCTIPKLSDSTIESMKAILKELEFESIPHEGITIHIKEQYVIENYESKDFSQDCWWIIKDENSVDTPKK